MSHLTFGQLQEAVIKTGAKYFVVIDHYGLDIKSGKVYLYGLNAASINMQYRKYGDAESKIIYIRPCSLMEYITYKVPFL